MNWNRGRPAAVVVLTLVAVLGVTHLTRQSPAVASQLGGSLRLSAEVAEPGARIEARGRVPTKHKRRAVLHRRVRGSWKPVDTARTSRRGRYVLATRLPELHSIVVRYRVCLPRWRTATRLLPRRCTPTDSVQTTAPGQAPIPDPPPSSPAPSPTPTTTATPSDPSPTSTTGPAGPIVARWEMNEIAGSTSMIDSSGRAHHGAISKDATSAGLQLNGSYYSWSARCRDCPPTALARVVQVPDSSELEIPDPNVAYTLEFRFSTTTAYGNMMQKGQSDSSGGQIKVQDPVNLSCVFKGASGRTVVARGSKPLNDGAWHTVACIHTSSAVSQWVDGVLVARTTAGAGRIDNDMPFVIGGKTLCDQRSVGCDYFTGLVDWTRISRG